MADGGPSSQSRQYRRSSVPNRRRDRETVDDDCAMRPVPVLLLSSVVFWTGGSRAAWISDGGAGDGINDINNNNNNNNMSSGNNITAGGWIGDVSERFYSDGKAFRSLRDTANGDGGNDGTGGKRTSKIYCRPKPKGNGEISLMSTSYRNIRIFGPRHKYH